MAVTAQITAAYEPLVDEFKAVADAARVNAEAQAAAVELALAMPPLQADRGGSRARSRKCRDRPGCSG